MATRVVASQIGKRYAGVFTAEDIDDIVATVVCKMWEARASFDPEKGKVFSWVWRIAQNAILDAMAKHRGISVDIEKVGGGTYELPVPENAGDSELLCDDKLE